MKALFGQDPLEARPSSGRTEGDNRQPSVGIVFALPAARVRPPELKRFLDSRPAERPGTLRVLLVLRNVGP